MDTVCRSFELLIELADEHGGLSLRARLVFGPFPTVD